MSRDQEDRGSFRRARRPEQKQQRELAILEAARGLALREGTRNVTLGDIAGEIGMHKTALLRYFESREEIYLRIATEACQDWAQALDQELKALSENDLNGVAEAFARTVNARPLLCDLFAHLSLNLERNVSPQSLLAGKLSGVAAFEEIVGAVRVVLPDLTEAEVRGLLGAVTTLAASAWQVTNPPPAAEQVFRENPALARSVSAFLPPIARFTETYILGLRARRQEPDPGSIDR
ncbi:TetR family transcriptional regulator [Streptomyces coeruleorubidus]|uniref:TetR family transcriptional regulator n=1 Tax=Streptomyces coeruleorubidus TaxID=116188 RepID=UPI0036ADDC5F